MCLNELDGVLPTCTCNFIGIHVCKLFIYSNIRPGKLESRIASDVRITFRSGVPTRFSFLEWILSSDGSVHGVPYEKSIERYQAVKQMDLEVRALPPEARQKLQDPVFVPGSSRAILGGSSQMMGDLTIENCDQTMENGDSPHRHWCLKYLLVYPLVN